MHDVIFAHILSQEIARETRRKQLGRLDPDELYKYEVWDSQDSTPTIKELFASLTSWLKRRRESSGERVVTTPKQPAPTQCAPQG